MMEDDRHAEPGIAWVGTGGDSKQPLQDVLFLCNTQSDKRELLGPSLHPPTPLYPVISSVSLLVDSLEFSRYKIISPAK